MSNSVLTRRKVLVVDDEAPMRELLKKYFGSRGLEAVFASTGEEAIEIVSKRRIDIVLLDIMMPEGSGLDILRALKNISPALKVIMMSAVNKEEVFRLALQLGAIDYILKPFDLVSLDARIFGKLLS